MDSTPLESGGTTITLRAAIIAVIVATGVGFIAPLGEAATRVVSEFGTFTLAFAIVGMMAWATRQASGWTKQAGSSWSSRPR